MYVQHQQHHPPSCQHQQAMQDYGDSHYTSYGGTGGSLTGRQPHRPQRQSHHEYPGYYGAYPNPPQMIQGVAPTATIADQELDRPAIASESSPLHWSKTAVHEYACSVPSSASSNVFYGTGNHVAGQDWATQGEFLCKNTTGSNPCQQLFPAGDITGVRRTLPSVTGNNSSFSSHQPDIRSVGTVTNRHAVHSIATLQQGYSTQHLQPLGPGPGGVCVTAEDLLSTRSPSQTEFSGIPVLSRGGNEDQMRGGLTGGGGGGGDSGVVGGRSVNQNQVPFDWMKKQIYPVTPSSGKTRTKDKYRIVYSEHQKVELEKEFLYNPYITIQRKAELASIIGLSDRQVKIWFQNRRAKERKQKKKRPPATNNLHDSAGAKLQRQVIATSTEQGIDTTLGVAVGYRQATAQVERNGAMRGRGEGGVSLKLEVGGGRGVLSDNVEGRGEVKSESLTSL